MVEVDIVNDDDVPRPTVKRAIIYTLPGHDVDTRLQVFDQEFQVHSLMLKIGSRYFRKFMDSADKTPAPPEHRIRYTYDTVVDDDGEIWGLEAVPKMTERAKGSLKGGLPALNSAIDCFERLLDCIYSQSWKFTSALELEALAKLADFFGAGPAVSISLDGAMLHSMSALGHVLSDHLSYLRAAYKLRNKVLYKESMIHVAGNWVTYRHQLTRDEDRKLRQCAILANAGITSKLDEINRELLLIAGNAQDEYGIPVTNRDAVRKRDQDRIIIQQLEYHTRFWTQKRNGIHFQTLAYLYRLLLDDKFIDADTFDGAQTRNFTIRGRVKELLNPLMQNNLVFDASAVAGAPGFYQDIFLSAEVEDADLPWDLDESDW